MRLSLGWMLQSTRPLVIGSIEALCRSQQTIGAQMRADASLFMTSIIAGDTFQVEIFVPDGKNS